MTRNLLQHIRHNKEAYVTASNVDLVQMADPSVPCRHCDVLELNVHVVLGCANKLAMHTGLACGMVSTFQQLAAIRLA